MSLSFQSGNKLRPVARVMGGKYNGKTISLNDKLDEIDETDFKKLRIPTNSVFQLLPDKSASRQIIYCTGASGSGKSTFTRKYVKEYKKLYKDREVYLFSALKEDESLDEIKPKRFRIDESLVNDPLDIEDFFNNKNKKTKTFISNKLNRHILRCIGQPTLHQCLSVMRIIF